MNKKKIFETIIPQIGGISMITGIILVIIIIWNGLTPLYLKLLAKDVVIIGCCLFISSAWGNHKGENNKQRKKTNLTEQIDELAKRRGYKS